MQVGFLKSAGEDEQTLDSLRSLLVSGARRRSVRTPRSSPGAGSSSPPTIRAPVSSPPTSLLSGARRRRRTRRAMSSWRLHRPLPPPRQPGWTRFYRHLNRLGSASATRSSSPRGARAAAARRSAVRTPRTYSPHCREPRRRGPATFAFITAHFAELGGALPRQLHPPHARRHLRPRRPRRTGTATAPRRGPGLLRPHHHRSSSPPSGRAQSLRAAVGQHRLRPGHAARAWTGSSPPPRGEAGPSGGGRRLRRLRRALRRGRGPMASRLRLCPHRSPLRSRAALLPGISNLVEARWTSGVQARREALLAAAEATPGFLVPEEAMKRSTAPGGWRRGAAAPSPRDRGPTSARSEPLPRRGPRRRRPGPLQPRPPPWLGGDASRLGTPRSARPRPADRPPPRDAAPLACGDRRRRRGRTSSSG